MPRCNNERDAPGADFWFAHHELQHICAEKLLPHLNLRELYSLSMVNKTCRDFLACQSVAWVWVQAGRQARKLPRWYTSFDILQLDRRPVKYIKQGMSQWAHMSKLAEQQQMQYAQRVIPRTANATPAAIALLNARRPSVRLKRAQQKCCSDQCLKSKSFNGVVLPLVCGIGIPLVVFAIVTGLAAR